MPPRTDRGCWPPLRRRQLVLSSLLQPGAPPGHPVHGLRWTARPDTVRVARDLPELGYDTWCRIVAGFQCIEMEWLEA